MNFSCEKTLLLSAINAAGRAVAAKSSITALEGILVEAFEGGHLCLCGYNLETGIRTSIEADVKQPGSLVLSAKLLGSIVNNLDDDVVTCRTDGLVLKLSCARSRYEIMGTDPEEFPDLPEVGEGNSFVITQDRLKSMISQTIFAVSDNEARPIHTGALFEAEGEELTVVAVDGYRLALRREKLERVSGGGKFSFVVPGAALREVEKLCADSDDTAAVTQGERHIMFQAGSAMLICRRLEGEFLNYRQTIPRENKVKVFGEKRTLMTAINRGAVIIDDKLKSPLRCTFGDHVFQVRAKTALNSSDGSCEIDGDGGGLEIGFNHRYLMDAVRAAPADTLRLELNTATSPCLILPPEGEESFLYMVLPVRLKAGE